MMSTERKRELLNLHEEILNRLEHRIINNSYSSADSLTFAMATLACLELERDIKKEDNMGI